MSVFSAVLADENEDFLDLSIEELLNATVSTASKFPQKTIDAPASVSIITAAEIDDYGYQTLGELLRSVRGMYATYDRNYEYLGVRGFGRTSNFNNRFLLLIDGYRVNDTFYENAAIGRDLFLDMDLIDRVEIVRGPGSSIYGSNAFFGVINVITKNGGEIGGFQASAEAASLDSNKQSLTFGSELEGGTELLLSVSRYDSGGHDGFLFEEPSFNIPEKQFGVVTGLDEEQANTFSGKAQMGNYSFSAAYVDRVKQVPTASFGSVINQPNETTDTKFSLGFDYRDSLGEDLDIRARAYLNRYEFERTSYYDRINEDLPPFTLNVDESLADWWGTDLELGWLRANHHLIAGIEYQDSIAQEHWNYDVEPFDSILRSSRDRSTWAVYVQDEIRLSDAFALNVGLRYDDYSNFGDTVNPRAALIYTPTETTAIKFLYGTAFRAPSEYELQGGVDRIPNLSLQPEEITTYEVVGEHYFAPNFRIIVSGFRNRLESLSELQDDLVADMLVYRNTGLATTKGAEVEVERIWQGGPRLRASYAWQQTEYDGSATEPANSPRHEIKLNFSSPFVAGRMRAAVEVQYLSDRNTVLSGLEDDDFPGYFFGIAESYLLTNVNMTSGFFDDRLSLALGVRNLFGERIEDPAGKEHDQNVILQDGRIYRLTLSYNFGR